MSKTVIVTGGAKGIGRGVALKFAKEGYTVILNYRNSSPGRVVEEITALGGECLPVQADVSDFAQAERLVLTAKEKYGKIDVLVNNAGITKDGLLIRMKEEDFTGVIDTNLKSAFNMIRHVSPIMLKQKSGAIVNISSVIGLVGNVGQANYAASKAGIIGLTKSAARELGARGITVNAVAPGFIQTDMTDVLSEEIKNKLLDNVPLKRLGDVADVADLCFFLAQSPYITGQTVNVDGGMVMY